MGEREPLQTEASQLLQACVHYGFCTAVCPTYVLLGDENDSPRGRIDLIREMLKVGGTPAQKTVHHLDRCLSCNACMTTCAAKVDYMHIVDLGRTHIERNFRRPLGDRLLRAFLARTLTHPRPARLAMRAARMVRPLASLLPARLGNLVALAPARLPHIGAVGPGTYKADGPRRMRVVLLPGCVQQALAPHINEATIRVLTRHGCEVVVPEGAACCGALPLHMGREAEAKKLARTTMHSCLGAVTTGPLDAVIVNASGCGTTVKDYYHLFRDDTDLAPSAADLSKITRDVSEILDTLDLKVTAEPSALKVAYHDACSLQHAQRIKAPPRRILRRAGFQVLDVPEGHFCCGSAGTYNLLQPDIAALLGSRKAAHIASVDVDIIATGNLGCITQLGRYTKLPIVHTVELVDWATGGPRPPNLENLPVRSAMTIATQNSTNADPNENVIW